MYIAHYADGKTITERDMLWDKIPEGITCLQMALPVIRKRIDPQTRQMQDAPSPTVTLPKMDAYFYEHEAVATMMAGNGDGAQIIGQVKGTEVARIIGGIDYKLNRVIMIRVDLQAFISVSIFPLDEMKTRDPRSIRKGI